MPEGLAVFLDFEASSLSRKGFPIEVAWVFETGEEEAHLIRPADDWTDWAASAEAVHRIPRDLLEREGTPAAEVARRALEALSGHRLYASAPSWDGKWLSRLLRAGGSRGDGAGGGGRAAGGAPEGRGADPRRSAAPREGRATGASRAR